MNDIIIVKPDKCTGCNACVRACPAPEANIVRKLENGKTITAVNAERCIACGECIKSCKYGARDYIDDTEKCLSKLTDEKTIILVSPAIKVAYPNNWKNILDWFKGKGCLIYDASFGADICSWAHLKAIEFNKLSNTVTQHCSAVVNYIELYQPKLLQNISPIQSPDCCAAIYIKNILRRTNPIALLSPCLARKREFEETGLIEYNVTFKKLFEYFDKNDIKIGNSQPEGYTYEFEDIQGYLGSVYSRPDGFRDCILDRNSNVNIVSSAGVKKVYPELEQYANISGARRPEIFDVLSCEYGCNTGAGTGKKQSGFETLATMRKVEVDARMRMKNNRLNNDKLYKKLDNELSLQDFIRTYKTAKQSMMPTAAALEPIYESLGMKTPQERTVDCGACGYKTCQEMVLAVYREQNFPENCIAFAKKCAGGAAPVNNEKLEKLTAECKEITEKLSADMNEVTEKLSAISENSGKTKEDSEKVSALLKNVVDFCGKNETMNKDTIAQLIKILETIISAIAKLDEKIAVTGDASSSAGDSVTKIKELIEKLTKITEA